MFRVSIGCPRADFTLDNIRCCCQVKLTVSPTERQSFVVCVCLGGKLGQQLGCEESGRCCELAEGDCIYFLKKS